LIRKKIIQLGVEIDAACDNKDISMLESIIEHAKNLQEESNNPDEISAIDYFIGNAWAEIDLIKNNNQANAWSYDRNEKLNAIKYFRKCISYNNVSKDIVNGIFIQAYTNLGNQFSEAGRAIYAIEAWGKALEIAPTFGMAGANLSHGLIYYANYLYDRNHSAIILRHCYKKLMLYLKCDRIHEGARHVFETDIEWLKSALPSEYLKGNNKFQEFSLGRSKKEKNYHEWVLKNSLYLNPLNDLFFESAIAHDVLHLPNMLIRKFKAPVFHGFFNEIKQQYITARYLYYQYKEELSNNVVHFSDKGRGLVNTLDYPQYGYKYEQIKNAFKMLYSLFDKIAYFINEYFELGIDREKVYFKNIWYKDKKINEKFENLNNNPLRGLYFLSKDFYSKDEDYLILADPNAQKMAELRNHLEHKYMKIIWMNSDPYDELRYDNLAYLINETEFENKTNRLLKCAREAVIYLSLAIHIEENRNINKDGIVIPIPVTGYD